MMSTIVDTTGVTTGVMIVAMTDVSTGVMIDVMTKGLIAGMALVAIDNG